MLPVSSKSSILVFESDQVVKMGLVRVGRAVRVLQSVPSNDSQS